MTATLIAQLEERAAVDLVADIIRGVLDESRQTVQDRAAELTMIAARQRLERPYPRWLVPLNQSNGCPGMGLDKTERPRPVRNTDRVLPIRLTEGEPIVSILHQTGDQRDHHRDNRRGGDGVGLARPRPPKPTARITLRQMRERAGVPLGDLAAQAGVSISTLRKFETGIPDLAPATYAHTIVALEALIARPAV